MIIVVVAVALAVEIVLINTISNALSFVVIASTRERSKSQFNVQKCSKSRYANQVKFEVKKKGKFFQI